MEKRKWIEGNSGLSYLEFGKQVRPFGWVALVFGSLGGFFVMSLFTAYLLSLWSGISFGSISSLDPVIEVLGFPKVFSMAMGMYVLLCLGIFLVWKGSLGFAISTLFRVGRRIRWDWMFGSLFLVLLMGGLMDLVFFNQKPTHEWTFDPARFWPFLPLALFLFPFQTLFEELLYRCFLMRWAFGLTRSGAIALLLSAGFFSLMHMGNQEVQAYGTGPMFVYYAWQGLMLGVLVMLSNGLEAAWAYHLANNLYGSLIISVPESSLPMPSLWQSAPPEGAAFLLYSSLTTLIMVLTLILVFRWRDWSRLFPEFNFLRKDKE